LRTNWQVYVVTLVSANTQYSQTLTNRVKMISVKCRDRATSFRVSLKAGEVASGDEYVSVFPGGVWFVPEEIFSVKTVYLASSTAGAVIEIEEWS